MRYIGWSKHFTISNYGTVLAIIEPYDSGLVEIGMNGIAPTEPYDSGFVKIEIIGISTNGTFVYRRKSEMITLSDASLQSKR